MSFQTWWQSQFGSLPPLGYVVREHFNERWFRIHSLPKSKRYPEKSTEYDELLRRHNAVANDVLGVGSMCWVVLSTYTDDIDSVKAPDLAQLNPMGFERSSFLQEPSDTQFENEPELLVVCWSIRVRWMSNHFDALIRTVADNREPRLLVVEENRSRIYAPYGGGADLILESTQARDMLRIKYADWLSSHPLGL